MEGDGKGEEVGMSAVESDCGIWAAVGEGADVGPVALEGRVMGETELSLLMSAMFGVRVRCFFVESLYVLGVAST